MKRPRRLICSCCGGTAVGRQWYNRDTGYGLCDSCVPYVAERTSPAEMRSSYGHAGIHYSVSPADVPEHLRPDVVVGGES